MKRAYILPILMVLLLTTCEERERSNPIDPNADPDAWAPSDLQVQVIDDSQIKLTWTQEDDRISGFRIGRKAGSGSFTQIAEVGKAVTEYTDTGLNYGTDYTYRIKAFTDDNESEYSTSTATNTTFPSPINLTAIAVDDQTIQLTWSDNCSFEDGYKLERSSGGSYSEIAELEDNVTEYTDTGLNYGTDYTYRVKTFTDINESDYATSNTTTMNIPPPTNLTGTPIDDQTIQLTWSDNCSFETGYRLERSEDGVSFTQIAEVGENITEYTDMGLTLGMDYTYRIKAFTALNESGHIETTVDFWQDCDGEWGGTAVEDCTGECNGTAIEDCTGECNGTAFENECGCVEGNTGLESDFCYGCTHPSGSNYNSNATIDDGTCFILMDFESGDDFSDWTLDGDWSYSDGSDYSSSFSDVFSGSYCAWSYQIGAWSTTIESSMSFTLTMGMGVSISFYYMGRNSSYGSFYFTIDGVNQNLPSTYDYVSETHEWQYIELDVDSGTHTFEWVTQCGSANYSSEFMVDFIHFQWDN